MSTFYQIWTQKKNIRWESKEKEESRWLKFEFEACQCACKCAVSLLELIWCTRFENGEKKLKIFRH